MIILFILMIMELNITEAKNGFVEKKTLVPIKKKKMKIINIYMKE